MLKTLNKIFIVSFLICSIGIIGCSDDSVNNFSANPQENNFTYPFAINSFWYYGTRNFVNNFRPDSLRNIFGSDTITGYGDARFIRDTVIGFDTLRILRNNHADVGHSHATFELYKQTDSGLVRYASYSNGNNFGPFRAGSDIKFSFNDKNYNSLNEIFNYYKYNIDNFKEIVSGDTTLILDDPPVNSLKYPVSENLMWDFFNNNNLKITKKYLDFENINLLGTNYYCIKIQRQWYFDNSEIPDANLISYDYFSKDGMVKRDFLIKDIAVNNKLGQVIGYIDAKEESFLNFYLQP